MNYSKKLLKQISYTTMSDYEMIILWKTKPRKIQAKVEEQMWLKYQGMVKNMIKKYRITYKMVTAGSFEDLIQEIFLIFYSTFNKIDVNIIWETFYFGEFVKINIYGYLKSLVKKVPHDNFLESIKTSIIPPSILTSDRDNSFVIKLKYLKKECFESNMSCYATPEECLMEEEIKDIYKEFKNKIKSKQDKKTLKVLEKYNGIKKDKEIYSKAGFNSQPAFFYQREKLKKRFMTYLQQKGYEVEL